MRQREKALSGKYGEDYPGALDRAKDDLNDVAVAAFKSVKPTTVQAGSKLVADQQQGPIR